MHNSTVGGDAHMGSAASRQYRPYISSRPKAVEYRPCHLLICVIPASMVQASPVLVVLPLLDRSGRTS